MVESKITETGGRELIFLFIVKIMSFWTASFGSLCCFVKIRLSVFSSPNPPSFSICHGGEWSSVLGLRWPGPAVKLEASGEVRGCRCLLQGAAGVAVIGRGAGGRYLKEGAPNPSDWRVSKEPCPQVYTQLSQPLRHYIFRSNYSTLLLGIESFLNLLWNNPAKKKKNPGVGGSIDEKRQANVW